MSAFQVGCLPMPKPNAPTDTTIRFSKKSMYQDALQGETSTCLVIYQTFGL